MKRLLNTLVAGGILAILSPASALAQTGGAPSVPAQSESPTPQQVVEHCLGVIRNATQQTLESIHATVERTGAVIVALEEAGAPPEAIRRAAGEGKQRVVLAGRRAVSAVNGAVARCLGLLRHIGAPPQASQPILEARRLSSEVVRNAVERALARISELAQSVGARVASPVSVE